MNLIAKASKESTHCMYASFDFVLQVLRMVGRNTLIVSLPFDSQIYGLFTCERMLAGSCYNFDYTLKAIRR